MTTATISTTSTTSPTVQRQQVLLQAVRTLTNNGHPGLAQELWAASRTQQQQRKNLRVLLPGEKY